MNDSKLLEEVESRIKYGDGGVDRDAIAEEFEIRKGRASDILRVLRYQGSVEFRFSDGLFYYTAD